VLRACGRRRFVIDAGALAAAALALALGAVPAVQVAPHPVAPRVDVLVDGAPFTSYLFLTAMPRPALFPLRVANGSPITGGTDDDPLSAARAGFWFAHGNVNGIDFAGSDRTAPRGRIAHRRIVEAVSSPTHGMLTVQTAWTSPEGTVHIVEDTALTFRETADARFVDRVTRLGAVNGPVRLGRTQAAQLGLQLAEGFKTADAIAGLSGSSTTRAAAPGINARWLAIPGSAGAQATTVLLVDHPHNPGFPNVWRIGSGNSVELVPTVETAIAAQESVTFRYRLAIGRGPLDAGRLEALASDFAR
jgi:hypothetical protein